MPSSMTHTYLGMDVYNHLSDKYKNKIKDNIEHYKLFCQGSDPYLFYNFRLGKKAFDVINIQSIMHHSGSKDYFFNIIKYINDNDLANNGEIMAYLYGNIAHFFLDWYAHPYIGYFGGRFDSSNVDTSKYNALHQKIEYNIDMYYIDKYESVNHKKFKTYKYIFNVKDLSPTLGSLMDYSIKNSYNIDNAFKLYKDSVKYMKLFFRILNYDPYGIKLFIYRIMDKITPWYIIKKSELSFYNDVNMEYLNLDGKKWCLPWNKDRTSIETFPDIMKHAMNDTVKAIIEIVDMLDNKELNNDTINNIFKDWSYATGEHHSLKLENKYYYF